MRYDKASKIAICDERGRKRIRGRDVREEVLDGTDDESDMSDDDEAEEEGFCDEGAATRSGREEEEGMEDEERSEEEEEGVTLAVEEVEEREGDEADDEGYAKRVLIVFNVSRKFAEPSGRRMGGETSSVQRRRRKIYSL